MRFNKRLLCLFLSIVMVFSIIPTAAFAATPNNGETGGGLGTGISPVSGWYSNPEDMWGLRFSLYFAEGATLDTVDTAEFIKLGEPKNIIMQKKGNNPIVAINQSIYERMGKGSTVVDGMSLLYSEKSYDYNSIYFSKDSVPAMSTFPTDLMKENKTSSKTVFNKFFAGVDTSVDLIEYSHSAKNETEPLDFKNSVEIANFLMGEYGSIPYDKTTNKDGFRDGYYIDSEGILHTGVFKLYYEPFTNFVINRETYWMTLRDCIAFTQQYSNIKVEYKNGYIGGFVSFFYSSL